MPERRDSSRRRVYLGAGIRHPLVLSQTECLVRNLSEGGARLALSETVPVPGRFELVTKGRDAACTVEVVWRRGDALGVRFLTSGAAPARTVSERAPDRGTRHAATRH